MDYHLDIQTWGNFNDNKPEYLSEPTHANFVSWVHHLIPELKIFQIGINNYNNIEQKNSMNQAISYLNTIAERITNSEIYNESNEVIVKKLPKNQDVYLSIDVDVLNRIYINNTGYPSALGINLKDVLYIINYICKNNNIIGVDIMEFGSNSNLQEQEFMSETIIYIILEIIKNIKT